MTVAFKKSDYNEKNEKNVFFDENTSKKVKKTPLRRIQEKVYELLKRWNENLILRRKYKHHELTQTDTLLPEGYIRPC